MFCLFDVSGGQKNSMRVLGNGQSIWQKKSLYASRETLSKAGSQSHFGCDTGLLQKCKSVQNRVNEMIVSYSLLIAKPEIYLWNKQQKTKKQQKKYIFQLHFFAPQEKIKKIKLISVYGGVGAYFLKTQQGLFKHQSFLLDTEPCSFVTSCTLSQKNT